MEQLVTFSYVGHSNTRIEVNRWLKENATAHVVDRLISTCIVTDDTEGHHVQEVVVTVALFYIEHEPHS